MQQRHQHGQAQTDGRPHIGNEGQDARHDADGHGQRHAHQAVGQRVEHRQGHHDRELAPDEERQRPIHLPREFGDGLATRPGHQVVQRGDDAIEVVEQVRGEDGHHHQRHDGVGHRGRAADEPAQHGRRRGEGLLGDARVQVELLQGVAQPLGQLDALALGPAAQLLEAVLGERREPLGEVDHLAHDRGQPQQDEQREQKEHPREDDRGGQASRHAPALETVDDRVAQVGDHEREGHRREHRAQGVGQPPHEEDRQHAPQPPGDTAARRLRLSHRHDRPVVPRPRRDERPPVALADTRRLC